MTKEYSPLPVYCQFDEWWRTLTLRPASIHSLFVCKKVLGTLCNGEQCALIMTVILHGRGNCAPAIKVRYPWGFVFYGDIHVVRRYALCSNSNSISFNSRTSIHLILDSNFCPSQAVFCIQFHATVVYQSVTFTRYRMTRTCRTYIPTAPSWGPQLEYKFNALSGDINEGTVILFYWLHVQGFSFWHQ